MATGVVRGKLIWHR